MSAPLPQHLAVARSEAERISVIATAFTVCFALDTNSHVPWPALSEAAQSFIWGITPSDIHDYVSHAETNKLIQEIAYTKILGSHKAIRFFFDDLGWQPVHEDIQDRLCYDPDLSYGPSAARILLFNNGGISVRLHVKLVPEGVDSATLEALDWFCSWEALTKLYAPELNEADLHLYAQLVVDRILAP